jgi:hypothetical protein
MWVRLTRKLAAILDGIDVSDWCIGEVFDLPILHAQLLIAEGWAEPHSTPPHRDFVAPDALSD